MIITCPNCNTSFTLPDELYVPGRKARCSNCRTVFTLPEATAAPASAASAAPAPQATPASAASAAASAAGEPLPSPESGAPAKKEKPKRSLKLTAILLVAVLISLAGIGFAGFMIYKYIMSDSPTVEGGVTPDGTKPAEDMSELERKRLEAIEASVKLISLDDIRQFVVKNDKLGNIVVVQGQAVNGFSTPKELIAVEVKLFDQAGNELAAKHQMAGANLTLFQLQVLDEKELNDALNNKVDILTNNTKVPPKGKVSFLVFFSKVPESFYEFEVRPISAKDPPKE